MSNKTAFEVSSRVACFCAGGRVMSAYPIHCLFRPSKQHSARGVFDSELTGESSRDWSSCAFSTFAFQLPIKD